MNSSTGRSRRTATLVLASASLIAAGFYAARARAQTAAAGAPSGTARTGRPLAAIALQSCRAPQSAASVRPSALDPQVRNAAQRSLGFLVRDTIAWQTTNHCFGCHVQAVTLEALVVGRQHQYTVAQSDLQQVIAGLTTVSGGSRGPNPLGVGGQPSLMDTGNVFGGAAFAHYDAAIDGELRSDLTAAAERLLQYQDTEGAVASSDSRFPTVMGKLQATTLAIQTWRQAHDRTADERWLAPIRRAEQALQAMARRLTDGHAESLLHLDYAVMGLVAAGASASETPVQSLIGQVRARQLDDGGWSYHENEPPNALATGQALYTLRLVGTNDDDAAVARGTRWLIGHQQEDGSWSRGASQRTEAMWGVFGLVSVDVLSMSVAGIEEGQHVDAASVVHATASDNQGSGVASVDFYVDDVPVQRSCAASADYTFDAPSLGAGAHTLDVVAINGRGQQSRRRIQVYTGAYYVVEPGARFSDDGTLLSWRSLAPSAAHDQVALRIVRIEGDGPSARHDEVFRTTQAATQGPMSFFWNGQTTHGAAPRGGHYVAEVALVDPHGGTMHRVEIPFVHDTLEAQHARFAEVTGNLSVNGAAPAANVRVDLVDDVGNVVQSVNSTGSGQYRFNRLQGGHYHVRVARPGFRAAEVPVSAAAGAAAPAAADVRLTY